MGGITKRVYVTGYYINTRPPCSSPDGILLLVSCIFVADGAKNGLQGEDSLEVEPLVCRGAGHGLAACLGVSTRRLSGVLCVGYSSDGILRCSIMRYAPVMLISLTRECDSISNLPTFAIAVQNRIAVKKGGCNIKTLQVPLSRFCK